MEDISDAALRRWAIQQVLENACLEPFHDTVTICRLATELVAFVKTGIAALEMKPPGTRVH